MPSIPVGALILSLDEALTYVSQWSTADRGLDFLLTISRCGIHDFFVSEGEPNLTRAFCAWDRNWLGDSTTPSGQWRLVAH